MFAWINFGSMILFTIIFVALYVRSVSPARLEARMGAGSYQHCGRVRAASIVFLLLITVNYVLFHFFPIATTLPDKFSWPYWLCVLIAILIAIPTGTMVFTGMKDAGDEALRPSKDSVMFGGIYERIRHPQTWEYGAFFTLAFLLNNPFLALYSIIWFPAMWIMMRAEERDLILRYGDDYQNYMEQTGRLLPKLR